MKHAGPDTFARLDGLIAAIRTRPGLVEKRPGVFYRRSQAFLHFHEDPAGVFADLREGGDWTRLRVSDAAEQSALLDRLDRLLAGL
jgi:hypothetical protein